MKKASSSPRPTSPKSAASPAARPSKPRAPRKKPVVGTVSAPFVDPTDTDIARRAYQIFLARNGEPGDALADWLQAEEELKAERRLKSDS
jgi:hypothetical protein